LIKSKKNLGGQLRPLRQDQKYHGVLWHVVTMFAGHAMENEKNQDPSKIHYIARPKRRVVSRTRIVMALLLIIAIPIFISLANRAVHENADAIRQSFGR
jgi:hypothetical protein